MKLLGINIDHIATLRNARAGKNPNLTRAVEIINKCMGVEFITIHLREDRRHINDADATLLCQESPININLEIACTEEMVNFAITHKPYAVCFVPENRMEQTTESGLDIITHKAALQSAISIMKENGIKTTLFLDPIPQHIKLAKEIGANTIEIHTGKFSNETGIAQEKELQLIKEAARLTTKLGMECHAGHGLNYKNIVPLAKIDEITLFNIGHFLVSESIYIGLEKAINKMYDVING